MLSLLEIMVSIFVMGLVGMMITSFTYSGSLSMLYANENLLIDNALRDFSELMTRDAGICDYAVLYKTADFNDRSDSTLRLGPEQWGDMLVFVRMGIPIENEQGNYQRPIKKIYVLERLPPSGNEIWIYSIEVDSSDGFKSLESLLPQEGNYLATNSIKVGNCADTSDTKRMVYNINGKTFLSNVELYLKYREEIQSVSLNFIFTCPLLYL